MSQHPVRIVVRLESADQNHAYWRNHSIKKLFHPRKLCWKKSWGPRQFFSSWVCKIPYDNQNHLHSTLVLH